MIAVIADDLTGAAELAGVGWRHGLTSEVLLSGSPGPTSELVCVDTDSRGCAPAKAAELATFAARSLASSHPEWIYKKVDSVLRGQVIPEIESILEQVRLSRALLLPANPSLGRIIRGGRYFVRGEPIDETEFARDPHYPRTSSHVLDLVQKRQLPLELRAVDGPLPQTGIVVGEVTSPDDLRRWAARCEPEMLPAGGAEFFNALLGKRWPGGLDSAARRMPTSAATTIGRAVFVCGTMSESARRFIVEAEHSGIAVFSLSNGGNPAEISSEVVRGIADEVLAALESHPRILLQLGFPPIADRGQAEAVSGQLIELTARVLEGATVERVFAEGGATARALAIRMGWNRLSVVEEVALGIVTLRPEIQPQLHFTIKPGSYLWPERIRVG